MTTTDPAKIVIIGTGAMGSVYAALMADAGHDVWAVDAWAEHVAAMHANGLRVEGASGDRTVKVNATSNAAEAGDADLVIIATKLDGVSAAVDAARSLISDDTAVLSIQNGLGGPDIAAQELGAERVSIGVVGGFGASMKGPGHAHHNGMEFVRIGEYQGGLTDRTARIADIWTSSGFKVLTFDDIHKMVWEKLVCNCAYSGPATILDLTLGEILADEHASAISAGCAIEAYEVARAKGIGVDIEDPVAYVRAFGEKIPNSRPSMAQDHTARKRGEIDAINGAIVREAEAFKLSVPTNAFVSQVIKARESVF
ncbi:MAG: 2-dehydropantoate 2-reductase [Pseudomonadota bacterium]